MRPACSRHLTFTCSSQSGWHLGRRAEGQLTLRGKSFLPVLGQFVRLMPSVETPVGLVQQVRLTRSNNGTWLSTLLSLQELPADVIEYGARAPRVLAPALFVGEGYDNAETLESRLGEERVWIGRYLGRRNKSFEDLIAGLAARMWAYDAVFELVELKAQTVSTDKGVIDMTFRLVYPPHRDVNDDVLRIHPGFPLWDPDTDAAGDAPLRSSFCLPWLPPFSRLLDSDACTVYLAATEESIATLRAVSDKCWQNDSAKNVLLSAVAGGGKEVVARLIHCGRAKGAFKSITAGTQTWEEVRLPLLGQGMPAGPVLSRGLVEEAGGGTVLIDEVDKAGTEVRQALLRLIEADEFSRPGSGETIRLLADTRPLYVFAGSGQGKAGRNRSGTAIRQRIELEPPPDFWQRIDTHIDIEHPLGPASNWQGSVPQEAKDALRKFVGLFMRRARDSYFCASYNPYSPYSTDKLLRLSANVVMGRVRQKWEDAVSALFTAFLAPYKNQKLSQPPSIRDIRRKAGEWVIWLCTVARVQELPTDLTEPCRQLVASPGL